MPKAQNKIQQIKYLTFFILDITQNMISTGVPKPQSCEKPTYQQHHKCTCGKLTIPLVCFYQQQLAEKERIPKAEEGHQRRKSRCADAKLGGKKRREGGDQTDKHQKETNTHVYDKSSLKNFNKVKYCHQE